jgi:hypothetical protein
MRGRLPSGPEFVAKLDGSEQAKRRMQVLLETIAGSCRVAEACTRLGISEQRFDQIRMEALQAAVESLEARPAGRPAQTPTPAEVENQRLRQRIAELEGERKAALIRAELAVTLPQAGSTPEKKTPMGRRRGRPTRSRKPS